MQKNKTGGGKILKAKHLFLLRIFSLTLFSVVVGGNVWGQTTVTIQCTGTPNTNSGNVTNGGSKNAGEIRTSGAYKGWARFDLSSIPACATITEATIKYNVFGDPANINRHYLGIFTGNTATMTGSQIYSAIGGWSGTGSLRHETTPNEINGTGWRERGINATGITVLQTNISGLINVGFGMGQAVPDGKYYRFRGQTILMLLN